MTSYNARTTADEIIAGVDLTGRWRSSRARTQALALTQPEPWQLPALECFLPAGIKPQARLQWLALSSNIQAARQNSSSLI